MYETHENTMLVVTADLQYISQLKSLPTNVAMKFHLKFLTNRTPSYSPLL